MNCLPLSLYIVLRSDSVGGLVKLCFNLAMNPPSSLPSSFFEVLIVRYFGLVDMSQPLFTASKLVTFDFSRVFGRLFVDIKIVLACNFLILIKHVSSKWSGCKSTRLKDTFTLCTSFLIR